MKSLVNKPRIFGYDLLKALTMIGIVFYHLHSIAFDEVPEDGSIYYPGIGKILYGLLCAGVPMFYMVNGAIVGLKNPPLSKCLKTAGRLTLLSVFWTLVFKWWLYPCLFDESITFGFGQLWEHYWFFYTFSFVYLITWILNRVTWLRWLVVGCLVVFPFLTNFAWDLVLLFSPETPFPSWGHSGAMTLYTIVYYYMGRSMARLNVVKWIPILSLVVGLVFVNFKVYVMSNVRGEVFDSVSSCLPTIGGMFINTGFFLLLKDVNPNPASLLTRFFSFIGQRTLGVYLFHLFFVKLVLLYCWRYQNQNPLLVMVMAIFISFLCSMLWRWCPSVASSFKQGNKTLQTCIFVFGILAANQQIEYHTIIETYS